MISCGGWVSEETVEVGKRCKEKLFQELHDYFTTSKPGGYASRIATFSSMVHSLDVKFFSEVKVEGCGPAASGGHRNSQAVRLRGP